LSDVDSTKSDVCFLEHDPGLALARRVAVEGMGTLLLMFAATGSGSMASNLMHSDAAIGPLVGALATSGALVSLILAFGPVSGGHYNPLISSLQWLTGQRTFTCALSYVAVQVLGASAAAILARLVFNNQKPVAPAVVSWNLALSEGIATAGLMIVVFGSSRAGRGAAGPLAVGAWLTAAIICSPSGSYANPAIAIGALFATASIRLQPAILLAYLPAEVVGGLLAVLVVTYGYPKRKMEQDLGAGSRLRDMRP
jgi:glycerol uptake facilitator-like aquaporin